MTAAGPVTILMVQAGTAREQLDLAEEHRQVSHAVSRAPYRDALALHVEQAVRPGDLSYLLLRHHPSVLHFSGTGTPDSGILLRSDDGGLIPIDAGGLRRLIQHTCPQVRLAVLNSCWSSELAHELANVCGCAVGMSAQLPDSTAIAFAAQLYQAIAFGQSIGQAVATARAALELHGVYQSEIIQLISRDDVNPEHVFIIPSWLRPPLNRTPGRPDATLTITRSRKRRYIAVVTGLADSADGFVSELKSASIENLEIQWIPAGPGQPES